jgi:predicted nuclease of restriction endonuclease-like RecB superfamily
MLVGKQLRVRFARDRISPQYLDVADPAWREAAERLLLLFRGQEGRTRGEIDEEVKDSFGNDPGQLVHQGLAKLLEDRCEFEVVSGRPPEEVREVVFRAAALARQTREGEAPAEPAAPALVSGSAGASPSHSPLVPPFDRPAVLRSAAGELGFSIEAVDQSLFADLKSEQRLVRFKDTTAERLLQRYNVALAQAVLLRATGVDIEVRGETAVRLRQLFRQIKFRRLVCEVSSRGADTVLLHLDGPLSLFSATQKYGLQLALFLPALLHCQDFELKAELLWGPQRKRKLFRLSARDGLVPHDSDAGSYVPGELGMFVELFRKRVEGWRIEEESEVFVLGDGALFWVPDFRLIHTATSRAVLLEVLGFWRRASAERHLQRLREHAREPFLLAVSDQLHIEDAELEGLPAGIHRFRQMPLPDEIARLAEEVLKLSPKRKQG